MLTSDTYVITRCRSYFPSETSDTNAKKDRGGLDKRLTTKLGTKPRSREIRLTRRVNEQRTRREATYPATTMSAWWPEYRRKMWYSLYKYSVYSKHRGLSVLGLRYRWSETFFLTEEPTASDRRCWSGVKNWKNWERLSRLLSSDSF